MIQQDEATRALQQEIEGQWQRLEELCEAFPDGAEWSARSDQIAKRYGVGDWELAAKEIGRIGPVEDEESSYIEGERYVYARTISKITERIARYVPQRNLEKLEHALQQLQEHASLYPEFIESVVSEAIEDAVDQLKSLTPTLIYESSEEHGSLVEIPRLIVGVSEILAEHVALKPELLYQMSPRRFEELMAEIFGYFGYEVELTRSTRDGGKDLIAISRRHGILSKTLVECKRYVPPNMVGVGHVRQLLGTKTAEVATRGIIVTTSYFTTEARRLEEQNKYIISLQDFNTISGWVQEYSQGNSSRVGRWVLP